MIQPPRIKENDKVIIVSPAGHVEAEHVEKTTSILEDWGLRVEVSPHALSQTGRFSGTVSERLADLQNAMDDPEAAIIFCSRGGYGTIHLLEKLSFSKFKKAPKWLVGFSDITALHALFQTHGFMSVHGPMALHFAEEGKDDFCVRGLKAILEGKPVEYSIPATGFHQIQRVGTGRGRLFGGNLAVFWGLLGTRITTIPEKGILFIEDIGEEPYKIDRFVHQLRLAGIFNEISGLIVGQFSSYKEDDQMYEPLYQSIATAVSDYDFPVCFNFPAGHVQDNYPLILGKATTLEVRERQTNFKQT